MKSVEDVVDALERAPEIVIPLVLEIPDANRKRRPSPGKWSAHEHAVHLAQVHSLFNERLTRMLAEDHPVIKPYNPGNDDPDDALLDVDLDESLAAFRRDRAQLVKKLRALSTAEWSRDAIHPEYSSYTVAIMFRHMALHDFLHAYRIEEIALNPAW